MIVLSAVCEGMRRPPEGGAVALGASAGVGTGVGAGLVEGVDQVKGWVAVFAVGGLVVLPEPGLTIGRTISGLYPFPHLTDRFRDQNPFMSDPVQQNHGRSQVLYDSNAIWGRKIWYRSSFKSGT